MIPMEMRHKKMVMKISRSFTELSHDTDSRSRIKNKFFTVLTRQLNARRITADSARNPIRERVYEFLL